MKKGKGWRTRTRGTARQKGKHFLIGPSQQKLKSKLPTVTRTQRGTVKSSIAAKEVELSMITVNADELVPSEHPLNLGERAQYFVDMYKRGETIPPILVHQLPNGKYEIKDGHARVEAYRQLGVTVFPAVSNDILKTLGKAATMAGKAIAGGARLGVKAVKYSERVAGYGYRTGAKVGKAAEESLEQAGRISRAYRGEVAPREEIEHEERLARIRAERAAKPQTVIREVFREKDIPSKELKEKIQRSTKWTMAERMARLRAAKRKSLKK